MYIIIINKSDDNIGDNDYNNNNNNKNHKDNDHDDHDVEDDNNNLCPTRVSPVVNQPVLLGERGGTYSWNFPSSTFFLCALAPARTQPKSFFFPQLA